MRNIATVESLEIKITSEASEANQAIDSLIKNLDKLSSSLKFDTTSLEKLGNINGNNFKKLSEGLQSFANAAKSLDGISKTNFNKLAGGIEKIASIDSSKLEALGKIDGNSFRGIGEGVKALSAGLQNLQGIKAKDFTTLANGIGKLAAIQPGNMEVVGNTLKIFTDGINSIGSLTFDTSNLSNLINGISRLGGKTATEAAKNLPPISAQLQNFLRQLNNIGSLNFDMTNLSNLINGISRLGGKAATSAVENIPQLANALKNLMQILSTSPTISQNVIQMTQALANLAAQGKNAGNASQNINNELNKMSRNMTSLRGSSKKLITSFKSLSRQLLGSMGIYVGIYGAVRGMKDAIKSSMDYIEILNYFDAAFGQVASNADLSAFEEMGYDSATAYYNSFAERAEEVTSKMTGFTVGKGGLLESTGMVSLGLDPSQLMNYQAMFGQMSSSMGVTSETALKLSQALTEIGADLASVKNMEFNKVWEDMASGLAGMSRTLDKYGVNIRNVNLQQKLNELGIEANITKLNQNDKALLRTIILLDSTKYAWGDLADTINNSEKLLIVA